MKMYFPYLHNARCLVISILFIATLVSCRAPSVSRVPLTLGLKPATVSRQFVLTRNKSGSKPVVSRGFYETELVRKAHVLTQEKRALFAYNNHRLFSSAAFLTYVKELETVLSEHDIDIAKEQIDARIDTHRKVMTQLARLLEMESEAPGGLDQEDNLLVEVFSIVRDFSPSRIYSKSDVSICDDIFGACFVIIGTGIDRTKSLRIVIFYDDLARKKCTGFIVGQYSTRNNFELGTLMYDFSDGIYQLDEYAKQEK